MSNGEKRLSEAEEKTSDTPQAFQVILYREVHFEHPREDIHIARQPISGAAWVDTDDGVVVVDTLLTKEAAEEMVEKIHEISGPVKYIIYTHGHRDHVGGAPAFLEDAPEIIAHRYLPERFEKYQILAEHRGRIASIQFNIPLRTEAPSLVYPTKTFDESFTFTCGGKTFELYHARAETDDHCWVFIPETRTAIVGDLIIGIFPNIGNPWKPTRFALSWARALEAVKAKEPELLLGNGAALMYQGEEVSKVLDAYIEAIYSIHDQVVAHINKDTPLDEMIHEVKLPDHLRDSPYLQFRYSRPEFAVYNIYRWYHGYFDHNPAHLLPRPQREVNEEIFNLIGDARAILRRAEELFGQGKAQLALQVLDVLLQHEPDHIEARTLRLRLLEKLAAQDYCLMSRNSWVYFMDQDKAFLRLKGQL